MGLKIILDPMKDITPFINVGQAVKVIDIESGIDISKYVTKVDIRIRRDEWVTAAIECDVGELEVVGVDVSEIRDIIKANYDQKEE